jgi:hypothetical protein
MPCKFKSITLRFSNSFWVHIFHESRRNFKLFEIFWENASVFNLEHLWVSHHSSHFLISFSRTFLSFLNCSINWMRALILVFVWGWPWTFSWEWVHDLWTMRLFLTSQQRWICSRWSSDCRFPSMDDNRWNVGFLHSWDKASFSFLLPVSKLWSSVANGWMLAEWRISWSNNSNWRHTNDLNY